MTGDQAADNFISARGPELWPDFLVPRGSVGLLRATNGAAFTPAARHSGLVVNEDIDPTATDSQGRIIPNPAIAVGADYQWIDASTAGLSLGGNFIANGGIGQIHAFAMDTAPPAGNSPGPAHIFVNADMKGRDGIIDLIDVTQQLGTLGGGGPSIRTGPGGNVRYMHMNRGAGDLHLLSRVFAPAQFGGSALDVHQYQPGETARYTDDSGTPLQLTVTPRVPNSNPQTNSIPDQFVNPGAMQVLAYPIDDKAGVVLMQVQVDDPNLETFAANHSLLVDTGGAGSKGSVEIGEIDMFNDPRTATDSTGAAVPAIGQTVDPVTGIPSLFVLGAPQDDGAANQSPTSQSRVNVVLQGNSLIDVWNIVSRNRTDSVFSPIDLINNRTKGEIVNATAASFGTITAETIGLAKSHTGVDSAHSANAVGALDIVDTAVGNTRTFTNSSGRNTLNVDPGKRIGIVVNNNGAPGFLVNASAREGLGNLYVAGTIGAVNANSDHKNVKGVHEGINAPIVALPAGAGGTQARIQNVNIGEGLLPTGSGEVARSGLFAGDVIQSIVNQGLGSDIRGDVIAGVALGGAVAIDTGQISAVTLRDGAIINSDFLVPAPGAIEGFLDFYEGRLGAIVLGDNIFDTVNNPRFEMGRIRLTGRGGIIGSTFSASDFDLITVDGGFGVINTRISTTASNRISGIITTGYGIRDSIIEGGGAITQIAALGTGKVLDTNAWTPSVLMSAKKKIDPYFGVPPNESTDLYKYLHTSKAKPKNKSISREGMIEDVIADSSGELNKLQAWAINKRNDPMRLDFGNRVDSITTSNFINGLDLHAGNLRSFSAGKDMTSTVLDVAGTFNKFRVGGTYKGNNAIHVTGPEGRLLEMDVRRSLYGVIEVEQGVGKVTTGGDLGSASFSSAGNVDTLQVGGSVLSGTSVTVNKTLDELIVAGDVEEGAKIQAHAISDQTVGGAINGDIVIR